MTSVVTSLDCVNVIPRTGVRKARQAQGLTIAGLARKVGITRVYMSYIENGHKTPSKAMAFLIAHNLERQPNRLFPELFKKQKKTA